MQARLGVAIGDSELKPGRRVWVAHKKHGPASARRVMRKILTRRPAARVTCGGSHLELARQKSGRKKSGRKNPMPRNLDDPPDLPTQLEALLHQVWKCEEIERRADRLNAAIDRDERLKRKEPNATDPPPDDRLRR
jgi:hypothetical protein